TRRGPHRSGAGSDRPARSPRRRPASRRCPRSNVWSAHARGTWLGDRSASRPSAGGEDTGSSSAVEPLHGQSLPNASSPLLFRRSASLLRESEKVPRAPTHSSRSGIIDAVAHRRGRQISTRGPVRIYFSASHNAVGPDFGHGGTRRGIEYLQEPHLVPKNGRATCR